MHNVHITRKPLPGYIVIDKSDGQENRRPMNLVEAFVSTTTSKMFDGHATKGGSSYVFSKQN